MIKLFCTKCDETATLKTHIRKNRDMIVECLGCGDIKNFKCIKLGASGEQDE